MASKKIISLLVIISLVLMAEKCLSQEDDMAGCITRCMDFCMQLDGATKDECQKSCEEHCNEAKGKKGALDLQWGVN